MQRLVRILAASVVLGAASATPAQQLFSDLVGNVAVRPVTTDATLQIPFITWGGDVATFHANGGLTTRSGSIYDRLGLKIQLTKGDDFVGQVKNYLAGRTPFLRGTMRMLGQASEVLGQDPATKPVFVLQLSWSAGDHVVAREHLKTLNDLAGKGKKVRIACQQGGPHVGLLYDVLAAAKIQHDQIEIVWVPDLTGPGGPAEAFRKDSSVDACCVITPDMTGLTGGIDQVGSGAEGTVRGAHVLVSTQQMSRSIADVYAVRSDWFKANRQTVEKFVAGYLQATGETVAMRDQFEQSGTMSPAYRNVLAMAQNIFGREVLPTLEVDAHGLLLDCSFVGLPGQLAFFQDAGNLNNFQRKSQAALDLAVGWGYARTRRGFDPPGFDYAKLASLVGLKYEERTKATPRIAAESVEIFPGDDLDERTIVSFTINFEPNQSSFSADQYGSEFHRAIESASTFGNAVVAIRGHSDPTKTLVELIQSGMAKGVIKRTGQSPNFRYFLNGRPLDLTQTDQMVQLIKEGAFDGQEHQPRQTMQAALNLSLARAQSVKKSIVDFAAQQGFNLDESQIQPAGVGITEPIIPKPQNMEQAKENMRVEFRIVRVPAEAIKDTEFDF
jgi:ABC-type nitrate/sulfonate/bicarbonate transport system substrate-binding protein